MSGMAELKQALVEIVGIAEKYDVGLGVTLSNQDSARYLFRLPSWSIVRAAQDGQVTASVRLREGKRVIGAFDIDDNLSGPDAQERIKASLYALQSSADNMRRYANTVAGITDAVISNLEAQGYAVVLADDAEPQQDATINTLALASGRAN